MKNKNFFAAMCCVIVLVAALAVIKTKTQPYSLLAQNLEALSSLENPQLLEPDCNEFCVDAAKNMCIIEYYSLVTRQLETKFCNNMRTRKY